MGGIQTSGRSYPQIYEVEVVSPIHFTYYVRYILTPLKISRPSILAPLEDESQISKTTFRLRQVTSPLNFDAGHLTPLVSRTRTLRITAVDSRLLWLTCMAILFSFQPRMRQRSFRRTRSTAVSDEI